MWNRLEWIYFESWIYIRRPEILTSLHVHRPPPRCLIRSRNRFDDKFTYTCTGYIRSNGPHDFWTLHTLVSEHSCKQTRDISDFFLSFLISRVVQFSNLLIELSIITVIIKKIFNRSIFLSLTSSVCPTFDICGEKCVYKTIEKGRNWTTRARACVYQLIGQMARMSAWLWYLMGILSRFNRLDT